MPWACSSSMALRPSREVTRQPVQPWDHDHVAGLELSPELLPGGAAHVPARGDVGEDAVVPEPVVGEDAALGGQPARALSLGDAYVAEYRWVHGHLLVWQLEGSIGVHHYKTSYGLMPSFLSGSGLNRLCIWLEIPCRWICNCVTTCLPAFRRPLPIAGASRVEVAVESVPSCSP